MHSSGQFTARAVPRVLSIAGSDPSGGAGIQADIKSISATGGYALAVITALTAQNTQGVTAVHSPPVDFLRQQLAAISADIDLDAVKIGMLADVATIRTVRGWLEHERPPIVVLDPVMVATSGDRLQDDDAVEELRALLPLAHVLTPNLPELAALLGEPLADGWGTALEQGIRLSQTHGVMVLVKGGHLNGALCPDALVNAAEPEGAAVRQWETPRVATRNTHGTGCSLSSALATIQARTGNWDESVGIAKQWLHGALEQAHLLDVGAGNGPVHHFHHLDAAATTDALRARAGAARPPSG